MTTHRYCDRCGIEMPLDKHFSFSTLNEYKVSFMGRNLCKECEKDFIHWLNNPY